MPGFAPLRVINKVFAKFNRDDIDHTPRTKTLNFNGDEVLTDGATATISGTFLRRNGDWKTNKIGEIDIDDAWLSVQNTYTINKNDKVSVNGEDFIVKEIKIRYADNDNKTKVYTFCNLKLIIK